MSAPPASAAPSTRDATVDGRIVAFDLARWLAIVGMMCAHLLPTAAWYQPTDDAQGVVASVVMGAANGNASTLFAVLAGASMVLATRGMRRRGAWAVLRSVAGRAVVLLGLGALLAALMPPVFVVLHALGWAMLLAAPLLLAPTWLVGAVGVVLAVVGGSVAAHAQAWRFGSGGDALVDRLDGSPLAPFADLTLTGEYPGVTWVAFLAVGIVVARLVLHAAQAVAPGEAASGTRDAHARSRGARLARVRALGVRIALVGALLAAIGMVALRVAIGVLGGTWARSTGAMALWEEPPFVGSGAAPSTQWWWQLADVPHTSTIADVARGVGVALVVVGVLLALVPSASRMPRILEPVRSAGAAPLTIYVLHVVVLLATQVLAFALGEDPWMAPPWWVDGFGALGSHVAGSIALGWLLARAGARGPLERMTSAVARSFAAPRGGA